MADHIMELRDQLEQARERHEAFHEQLDDPPEDGTPEFEEASRLLGDVEELLAELAEIDPTTARGAEAMTIAVLAHANDLRPSVYRMIERVYGFLSGLDDPQ